MDIQLVRIDDRLIHGQVILGWAQHLKTKRIILCDDVIASSDWEKELYLSMVPPDIEGLILNVEQLVEYIRKHGTDLSQTILLVNSPKTIERIIDSGIPLERVNVGGIHFRPGRKKLLNYLYLDDEEVQAFKRCIEKGVRFECQDVPVYKSSSLEKLLQ